MGDHAEHGSLSEGRDGAGDESTGRDVAGDGEEDYVVAGGGDSGHQRPAHAADSGALRRRRVQRIAGPAAGPALAAPGAGGARTQARGASQAAGAAAVAGNAVAYRRQQAPVVS